jgi:hypothetical protein
MSLPFLPGYQVDHKTQTNFPLGHTFDVSNGIRVENDLGRPVDDARTFPAGPESTLSLSQKPADFSQSITAKYSTAKSVLSGTSSLPAWVAYDRKVLRFYCYYKEAVFSSPIENQRVRKCVLYYYLEDDSVHIAEPRVENSGLQQGRLVKRHRVPKDNNEFVNLNDLTLGNELVLYARKFYIYDCDEFTRTFFNETGIPLGEPVAVPSDAFTRKNTVEPVTFKKLMHPAKEHMEASLGKQMGVDIQSTQKFFRYDREVLRFFCVFHDELMLGESRPYVVHYFLADDTVEVMEVKQANSGRDNFPAFLKRSKLPKRYGEIAPSVSKIGTSTNAKVQYYTDADFVVGQPVHVYGRELVVAGADDFTKNFYFTKYGMTEADFPEIQNNAPPVEPTRVEPPPWNGFGTEEDSMGSVLHLQAKIPKTDYLKLMMFNGVDLRFLAKLVGAKPQDKNRRFVVTYFMAVDKISVFEEFEANSGHMGGKFAEKRRVKNPANGEFYTVADLKIGTNIILDHFEFEILKADDFTQNYINANPQLFPADMVTSAPASSNFTEEAPAQAPVTEVTQVQQGVGEEVEF